ncbi:MAG: hypothetical protein ACOH2Q_12055 [Rhodococcus sp. (in: high G+C Gram-positive bacteria)]
MTPVWLDHPERRPHDDVAVGNVYYIAVVGTGTASPRRDDGEPTR